MYIRARLQHLTVGVHVEVLNVLDLLDARLLVRALPRARRVVHKGHVDGALDVGDRPGGAGPPTRPS